MASYRKFAAEHFFEAFRGHEDELAQTYAIVGVDLPGPFTVDAARAIVAPDGESSHLAPVLFELNDLSTTEGRDVVEQAASHAGLDDFPGGDITHQRAACWLYRRDPRAFEHAVHLLAVRSLRGGQIALFPGREARLVEDPNAVISRLRKQLQDVLPRERNAVRFDVHHHMDGDMLVVSVFCQRNAEVQLEFTDNQNSPVSTIRRPVRQDVIVYNQSTGDLEISSGSPKHREILRSTFAEAVFHDQTFFPKEELSRVLDLNTLLRTDFELPVRCGHGARLTAIKCVGEHTRHPYEFELISDSLDFIALLRTLGALGDIDGLQISFVCIELILESGIRGRKMIELRGNNLIKFNRESFSDVVYDYLRSWGLLTCG